MIEKMKHPLENVFNMDSPEEEVYYPTTASEPLPVAASQQMQNDDEEDKDINNKIDDIYDKALGAFEEQTAYIQMIEPRYAARNAEVAANYLKIALDAASTKAKVKEGKRKTNAFVPFNNAQNMTQNIVVADRNELLKMIKSGNQG